MKHILPGGCLCGALRYRCTSTPASSGYCHCRLCQRSTGAPVLAWFSIDIDAFELQGAPARFASSDHGERLFCSTCGTQIAYRETAEPGTIDVNTATLDNPALVSPRLHIYCDSRIPWFDTGDDLPRYAGDESG